MKNKNFLIITKEISFEELPQNALKLIIDGNHIKTELDFINIMSNTFNFPQFEDKICNLSGFLDWMTDLTWFDENKKKKIGETVDIILIIKNYNKLFNGNIEKVKFFIIENFVNIILPYWEKEVIKCSYLGTRKFDVYLVEDFKS